MHDIGFNGEHETNDHEHEEHGGIGEKLEIIFTVIGGLVLFGAHLLNLRLSRTKAI